MTQVVSNVDDYAHWSWQVRGRNAARAAAALLAAWGLHCLLPSWHQAMSMGWQLNTISLLLPSQHPFARNASGNDCAFASNTYQCAASRAFKRPRMLTQ